MSVRLIHKTYGLEPPLKVRVLKDWRGWKEGDEWTATTQRELRGAILQANVGNLEVEGYSQELVAKFNATQEALAKGFPTGPDLQPQIMSYKDRPGSGNKAATEKAEQEAVEETQTDEATREQAPSQEKARPLARKRKPRVPKGG